MKITKSRLKQLIKEELQAELRETDPEELEEIFGTFKKGFGKAKEFAGRFAKGGKAEYDLEKYRRGRSKEINALKKAMKDDPTGPEAVKTAADVIASDMRNAKIETREALFKYLQTLPKVLKNNKGYVSGSSLRSLVNKDFFNVPLPIDPGVLKVKPLSDWLKNAEGHTLNPANDDPERMKEVVYDIREEASDIARGQKPYTRSGNEPIRYGGKSKAL